MKRKRLVHFSLVLFAGAAQLTGAHPAGEALALTIAAPEVSVRESNLTLQVTMTNRTAQPMTLFKTNPGCDFAAEVKDANGHRVPLTQAGAELSRCQKHLILGRRILVTLKPGDSTDESYPIDLYYGLVRPGSYTVQLTREVPAQPDHISQSNEIVLNLVR
jgi:hypothetical protein